MSSSKKTTKRKVTILLICFISILIIFLLFLNNRNTNTVFYEKLHLYLSNNDYTNFEIEEDFLKNNDLFDENFICNSISYSEGILEFFDCQIEQEEKTYCSYDGTIFECQNKDLKSDFNVSFSSESALNEYNNKNVQITTKTVENSELEINRILYCETGETECYPSSVYENNSYELSIESKSTKICLMSEYTDGSFSDIICSEEYMIDKTGPKIEYNIKGTKGSNNWYISDVELKNYSAVDQISGLKDITANITKIDYETKGENIIITATDFAGNKTEEIINVKVDKTAPIPADFSIKGTKGNDEWYISDVFIESIGGSDSTSGISSINVSESVIDYDTKKEIITLTTTDNAGHISTKSITLKVDKTKPEISYNLLGTKGNNDWYTTDVEIKDYISTDNLSGIESSDINKTLIDYETLGENIVMTATDLAGNKTEEIINVKVDKTAPIAKIFALSGTLGDDRWYISDVSIKTMAGSDAMSGLANTTLSKDIIDYDTTGETISLTTYDNAGNKATREIVVKVDKTGPTLTVKSEDIEIITFGSSISVEDYFNDADYGISGKDNISCNPTNTASLSIGSHTLECTAVAVSGKQITSYKSIDIIADDSEIKLTDQISNLTGNGDIVNENGLRYQGANPNNYITFNNEEWRIIGLFDTSYSNGTTDQLIKIIKSTPIDNNNDGIYNIGRREADTFEWAPSKNNWANSNVKTKLNELYYNKLDIYTETGIASEYRTLIEEVNWNLGGIASPSTAEQFYTSEKGTSTPLGFPSAWTGNVGLMYQSDYMYAVKENDCSRATLSSAYNSAKCHEENWLFILDDYTGVEKYEWVINTYSSHDYLAWNITSSGNAHYNHVDHEQVARPVIYLSPDILIESGTGSQNDPYQIKS